MALLTPSAAIWAAHTPALALDLSPEAWRDAAALDLAGMHDALAANGPFMVVDRDSAGARRWLEEGEAEGRRALPGVHDGRTYLTLLRRYAGGFRDSHISVRATPPDSIALTPLRWPGFAMAWRDGGYEVGYVSRSAAVEAPPLGARLIGCDGRPAKVLARERLDRARGNLELEAARVRTAAALLWDYGDPQAPPPLTCVFHTGAEERTWPLMWRPWMAGDEAVVNAAVGEPKAHFGAERWGADAWWIGAPTMTGEADWKALYDKVDADLPALRSADVIVVDLRGNDGGDSSFGYGLATRLWGEALVQAHLPSEGRLVFRSGPLSRQWAHRAVEQLKDDPDDLAEMKRVADALDKAAPGAAVVFPPDARPAPSAPPANPVKGRVVVLVDHACVSACLDTLDLFTRMPGVWLAGTETNADTIFMDIMSAPLPSGHASLGFGIKAWSERARGSNVTYAPAPDLRWTGALSDQAGLKHWLAERLGVTGAETAVPPPGKTR